MSDEELVKNIIVDNNSKLFGILYDKFSKKVYNICYGFARDEDEAKDLTQDVFLKLFVKLSSFKGKAKFSTWLHSFTYNFCVNYVTRNKTIKAEKRVSDFNNFYNLAEESVDANFYEVRANKLNKALQLISSEDKKILMLKYQENLTIKNIEDVLGIGSSAVKMRIKRAKSKLVNIYA